MKITVNLIELDNEYIATCPELDINCYGADKNEAVKRIQNVINFYLNSAKELGLDVINFNEIQIDGKPKEKLINNSTSEISQLIN